MAVSAAAVDLAARQLTARVVDRHATASTGEPIDGCGVALSAIGHCSGSSPRSQQCLTRRPNPSRLAPASIAFVVSVCGAFVVCTFIAGVTPLMDGHGAQYGPGCNGEKQCHRNRAQEVRADRHIKQSARQ